MRLRLRWGGGGRCLAGDVVGHFVGEEVGEGLAPLLWCSSPQRNRVYVRLLAVRMSKASKDTPRFKAKRIEESRLSTFTNGIEKGFEDGEGEFVVEEARKMRIRGLRKRRLCHVRSALAACSCLQSHKNSTCIILYYSIYLMLCLRCVSVSQN